MLAALFALALAQAAPGASPAPVHPPATAAQAQPKSDGDKVICKSMPSTGSLFSGPKECHTKADWDAEAAANRSNVGNYQTRARGNGG